VSRCAPRGASHNLEELWREILQLDGVLLNR
jgi:hypothetical protein